MLLSVIAAEHARFTTCQSERSFLVPVTITLHTSLSLLQSNESVNKLETLLLFYVRNCVLVGNRTLKGRNIDYCIPNLV